MTDITTFPTIQQVIHNDGPTWTFTATEAVSAGQAVGPAATGVSNAVVPMDATVGENALGVALFDAAAGAKCTVCLDGSIVTVANADDTTAIDAGGYVMQNDNSVKGTVSEFTPRADLASTVIDATNDTTIDGSALIVGQALEDIAGGGTGKILVKTSIMLYSDHAVVA